VCRVRHDAGHSTETAFAVRLGGKADSDTQADCKASTTAKRNALLMAFNIVIRQDCLQDEDDPRNEGTEITQEQADELRDWVDAVGRDRRKFLDFAKADSFEKIQTGQLAMLQAELKRAERVKR
jgi:hypothetical protein